MPEIFHAFVDPVPDDPLITGVRPSNWNAPLQYGNVANTGPSGVIASIKTVLMGDVNYYITATGSDSNPGTLAQPWATLQHAMQFLSESIDIAGHNVFINIGAGTFVGVGLLPTAGGGNIMWVGSGSANTFIDNGIGGNVVNNGECISIYFGINTVHGFIKMTFKPSADVFAVIDSFASGVCDFYDNTASIPGLPDVSIDCTALSFLFDVVFWVDNPSAQFIDKSITYVGGGATISNVFLVEAGGEYIVGTDGSQSSVTGVLNVTANGLANGGFAFCDLGGAISAIGSFTGSAGVNGPRYVVGPGGSIALEGQPAGSIGPNFFPGSASGICAPGGTYDGFNGAIQASGLPTTTQFPDSGTGGLYKDTSGGNVYIVYNDAGTIRKAQLT